MATRHRRDRPFARLQCEALEPRETPAGVRVIDFASGFTPDRLPGGLPAGYANGDLLLTDGPFQALAVWARARVDVRAFHTSFVFQPGEDLPASNGAKGDGITFALASSTFPSAGVAGSGLGYQGLTESVAVKFDLVDNAGEGTDSVGVFTGGAAPTAPAANLDGTGIYLHSGHQFQADIAYDGSNLTLTLTDLMAPARTWTGGFAVDIPGALGASTGYVGFTAGTGELFARQTIRSWTYAEDTPPAPMNRPPEFTSPIALSWFTPGFVSLYVNATDDGGAAGLTYTWEVVSAPDGVNRQLNIHSPTNVFAQVDRGGHYVFRVTVTDEEGQTATSQVSYVFQTLSLDLHEPPKSIPFVGTNVFPQETTVPAGGTVQFVVDLRDPLGNRMPVPTPVWQVNGPGTIDSSGLYTAPADASGPVTIQAAIPDSQLPPDEWPIFTATAFILPNRPSSGNVDFGNGFNGADLTGNGSAQLTDNRIRLTDGPYQAGSAYAPIPVDVRGFTTSFRFQVGDMPSWWHGDGLTFVLQNVGPTAVGVAGGGLGYQGIGQSVAIKFDLVDNAGEGTASVGVFTGGANPTRPADTFTSGNGDAGIQFNNGHVFQADLSYSGGTLLLNLRDTVSGQQFSKIYTVNIPAAVGGPMAFVGFTAGTGELFAPIDILDWTYTQTTDASGNAAPVIVFGLTPDSSYDNGTSTRLRALAVDDGRVTDLWYTWEVVTAPDGAAPVRFQTTSFHNSDLPLDAPWITQATFDRAGEYTFRVTVRDAQGNATRSDPFAVVVVQEPWEFVVTPAASTVMKGGTVVLTVEPFDQFGDPLVGSSGGWHFVVDGPGYIDTSNVYHAPQSWTGPVTIRATNGTVTGATIINVVDLPPTTTAG